MIVTLQNPIKFHHYAVVQLFVLGVCNHCKSMRILLWSGAGNVNVERKALKTDCDHSNFGKCWCGCRICLKYRTPTIAGFVRNGFPPSLLYQGFHQAIRRNRPGKLTSDDILLHNNARPHIANVIKENIQQNKWRILGGLYIPDL